MYHSPQSARAHCSTKKQSAGLTYEKQCLLDNFSHEVSSAFLQRKEDLHHWRDPNEEYTVGLECV